MSAANTVSVREETVVFPTYKVHAPEKAPMYLERRAYQGSSGRVYPFPVTERIDDTKEDVPYRAVILENEYLYVMILPELGGRIQRALDKTNGYDFVYFNHVVKPALVGLTGPWISGGIEFNWPQHHRPTTFSPVDHAVRRNEDGSCTVFVGETDRMYGTKGMAEITLRPGKAYIEIRGRLYNPTDLPQTFLWWANPAVPVNDDTFSVFPPDVNAVMDHGRRAVSTFPIATGEYYKVDYSAGVDISRYKNVKVPTSYMAAHSDCDFIGNYDEGVGAGLLHVADHHVSPGKKQWTWGNGDFGRSWDRNLTDADGPYIELMTGVFTDNQPDFSWLKPHEEKTFVQYFMPYKGVGRVGNATRDCAVALDVADDGAAELRVYASGEYPAATMRVTMGDRVLYEGTADLAPKDCFRASFAACAPEDRYLVTVVCAGRTLVSYDKHPQPLRPVPAPADPMRSPEEMGSAEELLLAARHLEQYRHASYDPEAYYREGLRRDGGDIRLNDGLGMLLMRRGQMMEALACFEKAVARQTRHNPNPYEGACYFHLGLALDALGREDEALDAFYKATWSAETQGVAFFYLACIASRRGECEQALAFAFESQLRNWHSTRARALRAAMLRKLGRDGRALAAETLAIDPLDHAALYEAGDRAAFLAGTRGAVQNHLALALFYMQAGLWADAEDVLAACDADDPLLYYTRAACADRQGDTARARELARRGEAAPSDYVFPNRAEEIAILENAVRLLGKAPMASYYLGCLFYDRKRYEDAVACWEASAEARPDLAMARRNLAIACWNRRRDAEAAWDRIQEALRLAPHEPRFLLEADQLAEILGKPVAERLAALESRLEVVETRDARCLRYITLLVDVGRCEDALARLAGRRFHPWEGGEGKVSGQYRTALWQTARERIAAGRPEEALPLLEASLTYPENLGEGKLPNVPDNEAHFLRGEALRAMGCEEEARAAYRLAASGDTEPAAALYYNEQPSDYIYWIGRACAAMGETARARKAYHQLVAFGERHLFDKAAPDYFAVSLPETDVFQDSLQKRSDQYCRYLRALGLHGLGRDAEAAALVAEILAADPSHQGALLLRANASLR